MQSPWASGNYKPTHLQGSGLAGIRVIPPPLSDWFRTEHMTQFRPMRHEEQLAGVSGWLFTLKEPQEKIFSFLWSLLFKGVRSGTEAATLKPAWGWSRHRREPSYWPGNAICISRLSIMDCTSTVNFQGCQRNSLLLQPVLITQERRISVEAAERTTVWNKSQRLWTNEPELSPPTSKFCSSQAVFLYF